MDKMDIINELEQIEVALSNAYILADEEEIEIQLKRRLDATEALYEV